MASFDLALMQLKSTLDDHMDDEEEVDLRTIWPADVMPNGSVERLAPALCLRREDVKRAVYASGTKRFDADAIASLFESKDGMAGYRKRCQKATKRTRQVQAKKIKATLVAANFEWAMCPIGRELLKEPMILPCGHTFEKKALKSLRPIPGNPLRAREPARRWPYKCPTCRAQFRQPEAHVNYALKDAIVWMKKLPKRVLEEVTE